MHLLAFETNVFYISLNIFYTFFALCLFSRFEKMQYLFVSRLLDTFNAFFSSLTEFESYFLKYSFVGIILVSSMQFFISAMINENLDPGPRVRVRVHDFCTRAEH